MKTLSLFLILGLAPSIMVHAYDGASEFDFPEEFSVQPPIYELSGAVLDRDRRVIWTLGDSGNPAALGRTDVDTLQTDLIDIEGAVNYDWEALVRDQNGLLWILDVGDNKKKRQSVVFYQVDPDQLTVLKEVVVTYPDGAADVEGAFYDNGYIYLVTKSWSKSRLLRVDTLSPPPGKSSALAEELGHLGKAFGLVTDASVTPDGNVFLLTYSGLHRLEGLAAAMDEGKTPIVRHVTYGFWGKAEALIGLDQNTVLIGNEDGKIIRETVLLSH